MKSTLYIATTTLLLATISVPITSLATTASDVKNACAADKSPRLEEIHERGVLRWGIGIAPPFGIRTGQNEYAGTEAENAKEFASLIGVDVEIEDYQYNLLPPAVSTGRVDIVGASLYVTDARKDAIAFSDIYQREGTIFATLASRDDLNSIADLNRSDISVAVNIGSGYVDLSKKLLPKAKIIQAELVDYSRMANFLVGRQSDAAMLAAAEYPLLQSAMKDVSVKAIGSKRAVIDEMPEEGNLIEPFDVGFGVKKNQPGYLACVNTYVAYLKTDNRFRERYLKWVKRMAEKEF